jgi:probable phosphoglycerate mutase
MPAKSTTLYVTRHGETDHNRDHIMQGSGVDSALNDTGRAQAEALAARLADASLDAVYASTLIRARQTAKIVAAPHEPLPYAYLDDLKEISWGVYEGTPRTKERTAAMKAIKRRWRAGEVDAPVEGGESPRQVERRARRAIDIMLEAHAGEHLLVVTHGRFMRIMLASLLYEGDLTQMPEVPHSNTGLYVVTHTNGAFEAHVTNSVRHLAS